MADVLDADRQTASTAWTMSGPANWCWSAAPEAWFTYYYWLDDAAAPDFAQVVEIHRKPGYDPAELLFDPADPAAAKRRAAIALVRKKAGLRYRMSVVGLDAGAAAVRGSHGRIPDRVEDSPVLLCSEPVPERLDATEVKALLLRLMSA